MRPSFLSFSDELMKIAAKVPLIHGTSGRWSTLKAGVGSTILKNDPNPRGVYGAMKNSDNLPAIEGFARQAVRARGGAPVVAHGKVDTKKGWKPAYVKPKSRSQYELEDLRDLADSLDTTPDKKARGKIWRELHEHVGAWANHGPDATMKPRKYKAVKA